MSVISFLWILGMGFLIENHMGSTNKLLFPTYEQMYPESNNRPFLKQVREKLRYYGYSFLYKKQCKSLVRFLNENPQWQSLFTQCYYRFNALLQTYCDQRFSASQRLTAIIDHFQIAERKLGTTGCQQLLKEHSILLSELPEGLNLYLNINSIDPFEGYFSLSIRDQEQKRIYDASFTFLDRNKLLIASIQGPAGDNAQDIVRNATKAMYGIRPMFMIVNVFKILAEKWQCELVGIPHKAQGKYRLSALSKILFNYNEFWQENQANYHNGYWFLPLTIERKSLDDIASKKRSMYRKCYAMLDKILSDIQQF